MYVLLVDGLSLAVRRFYAMGGAEYLDSTDVGETRIFLHDVAEATVEAIRTRFELDEYDYVRVALESPPEYEVWRYSLYDDYKYARSRPDKPKVGKACQSALIPALVRAEIPARWAYHMEADDVLASMCSKTSGEDGIDVDVWTSDKDLWQVLAWDSRTRILVEGSQGNGEDIQVMDAHDAQEELGVPPDAIPLYKALVGDSSDNLRGVEGIGPARASKIIRRAPFRAPCPYIADPDLAKDLKKGEELASLLLSKFEQVKRDTKLASLIRNADVRSAIKDSVLA